MSSLNEEYLLKSLDNECNESMSNLTSKKIKAIKKNHKQKQIVT